MDFSIGNSIAVDSTAVGGTKGSFGSREFFVLHRPPPLRNTPPSIRPSGTFWVSQPSYLQQPSMPRREPDFESLVHEHHAALFRFALSMTRNEADAADLVQETFLRWAERGHQLSDPTKAKSWLFTTLYREAFGRRRRLIRFPHQPVAESEAELPEVPPCDPARADSRLVLEALAQLDDGFRAAVALFFLEDYSYPEIAEILQIPLGTVKSRIARGIARLQQLLQSPPQPQGTSAGHLQPQSAAGSGYPDTATHPPRLGHHP